MYMNKTVRFFGRIVAHAIQHANPFLDKESYLKPAKHRILQMDGCSENASKIELEIRLAELNWILRQLQGPNGRCQTTTRRVARSRSHTPNARRLDRRPRLQLTQND
jgi:hypothetical protein